MSERASEKKKKSRTERRRAENKRTHHRGPGVDPLGIVDETVLGSHQLGLDGGLGDVLSSGVRDGVGRRRGDMCVSEEEATSRAALTTGRDRALESSTFRRNSGHSLRMRL